MGHVGDLVETVKRAILGGSILFLVAGCLGSKSGSEIEAGHRPGDSSALEASILQISAGNAQSAQVASALPIKIRTRVLNAVSQAIASESVSFTIASGGGSLTQSLVATDADGYAESTWTLGTVSGAQTVTASIQSGSISQTFSATAIAGPATSIEFQTQPAVSDADVVLSASPIIRALDAYGNVATTYTQAVTASLQTNPGAATLGGTATVSAVAGIATFSNLTVDRGAVGYRLRMSDGTLGVNSSLFNVRCAPILDSIAAPIFAYSTRKLRSAYAGSAFRARRSDGVFLNIGFDAANCGYDESALQTFAGGLTVTVATWYDQVGARDAIQAATASQPRIVSLGAIDKFNSRQTIRFFGSESLPGADPAIAGTGGFGYSMVFRVATFGNGLATDGNGLYFLDRTTATNNLTGLKLIGGKISLQKRTNASLGLAGVSSTTSVSTTAFQRAIAERARGVQYRVYVNGALEGTLADADGDITPPIPLLGKHTSTLNSYDFGISEFLYWSNPQMSADRNALDANQAKYF